MSSTPRFARGTTIRIRAEVTDYNDNYIDPSTSIEVQLERNGTAILAYAAMTQEDTGKYYYRWQSSTVLSTGKYECKVKAVHNSYTTIEHDERAFYLY
jgi:hypothetical protein